MAAIDVDNITLGHRINQFPLFPKEELMYMENIKILATAEKDNRKLTLNKLNGSTHKQIHAAAASVLKEILCRRHIQPTCTIVSISAARMTDGDRPVMNA